MDKMFSLQLDPYMAMMLDLLVAVASEFAQGNIPTAIVILRSATRLGHDHPESRDRLLKAMEHIADQIPPEIVKAEGMMVVTMNDIRRKTGGV